MSSKDTPAPIPVPVTNSVPPPSYTCVLVELPMPPRVSGTSIKQLLINDAMLEKAVKETTQCLYVHVLAPSDATASPPSSTAVASMLAYVSAIYERLWDEMVGREHLSLKCIVTCGARDGEGDEEEGGEAFPKRAQVYMEPSLEAVFCYPGGEDAGGVYMAKRNAERVASSLPALSLIVCAPLPLDDRGCVAGGEVYFFDDVDADAAPPICRRVALGGTFDRLHNGHRKLLALASRVSRDSLVVGIMSDHLLRNKKGANQILPFAERRQAVEDFLRFVRPAGGAELVELQDPFGPTITDPSVDGIVVSSETLPGAVKINVMRSERSMRPLCVGVVRRSQAATLSSTFLRGKLV